MERYRVLRWLLKARGVQYDGPFDWRRFSAMRYLDGINVHVQVASNTSRVS